MAYVTRLPSNPLVDVLAATVGTPKRDLILVGAGRRDPAVRDTGFGMQDDGPIVLYLTGGFRPVLTCDAATGFTTPTGLSTTLATELTTTRRGPLAAKDAFVGSECPKVLVRDRELSLGPSETNTRRGPSPDNEGFAKDDTALLLVGCAVTSCGASTSLLLFTVGEETEGSIFGRTTGGLIDEIPDVLLDRLDVEVAVGAIVGAVVEMVLTMVDGLRDSIFDRFTIFRAGTGFGGCWSE
jgi:hypothetical protein